MGVAVVTGASSGMGKQFAIELSKRADITQIWSIARKVEQLDELKKQCGDKIVPVECDLTNEADIEKYAAELSNQKPEVTLLVNCAGFAKFGTYNDIPLDTAVNMVNLDVIAIIKMTRLTLPFMPSGSRVINIASTAAFQPLPGMNVYAASKAFVLSYSQALYCELKDKNISVTAVCPGWTKTNFNKVAESGASSKEVTNFMFATTPQFVVEKSLKAAEKRKPVCTPGAFPTVQRFFAKILPVSWTISIWNKMRK